VDRPFTAALVRVRRAAVVYAAKEMKKNVLAGGEGGIIREFEDAIKLWRSCPTRWRKGLGRSMREGCRRG
jgi:hypothetical protein